MQQSRPNPFPAPHERFMYVEERFFDNALATFHAIFPDVAADQNFAQIASRLSFSLLDSLSRNRIIDVSAGELEMVLEAFNAIVAPYFPATRRVSRFVAVPPVRPALAGAPPDQQLAKAANGAEQFDTGPPDGGARTLRAPLDRPADHVQTPQRSRHLRDPALIPTGRAHRPTRRHPTPRP